jgi:integrase
LAIDESATDDMNSLPAPAKSRAKTTRAAFRLLLQRTERRVNAGVRAPRTLEMQAAHAEVLLEHLGARTRLKNLTSARIAAALEEIGRGRRRRRDGTIHALSGNTVRKLASTLSQAIELAQGRPPKLPEIPYKYQPCRDHLERHEYERIRDALPLHRRLWFVVAVWTGQRHSDVERMRREDLDVDQRWVIIRSTKTKRAGRRFHAAPELCRELEAHWRALPTGARLVASWPHAASQLWYLSTVKLGMQRVTPHRLRHTFFTWFVAANGFTPELLELGGWRDLTIPALVYAHAAPKRLKEQIERTHRELMRRRAPRKVLSSAIGPATEVGGQQPLTADPPKPAHEHHATS